MEVYHVPNTTKVVKSWLPLIEQKLTPIGVMKG